jgi:hypothetical protein
MHQPFVPLFIRSDLLHTTPEQPIKHNTKRKTIIIIIIIIIIIMEVHLCYLADTNL